MAIYAYGLGKGLKEPCYPYRSDYIFGAALNDFNAEGWNCLPNVWDAATAFDLSAITSGKEVAIALLKISGASAGEYNINFRWYRDRDDKLLYDYTFSFTASRGGWLYAYSYLGWVDWEINENGSYRVEITVTGVGSYSRTIPFTISGIPIEPPPPPPDGGMLDRIFSYVWDISDFFHALGYAASEIPIVGSTISAWFYAIYRVTWYLLTPIANLGVWIDDVTSKIANILTLYAVWSHFKFWFDAAEIAYNWVRQASIFITYIINNWWNTQLQELSLWWNTELSELREVKVKWDYFWTVLYPKSVNWPDFQSWWLSELSELQGLINSSIKELEPLWAGWQDWRGKVTEFFTDPEGWLYKAFDRIIERFW